jgi:hypothetical protein
MWSFHRLPPKRIYTIILPQIEKKSREYIFILKGIV